MPVDHYHALKVPRNASKAQIKSSFYQLSKAHHPDLSAHPDSPDHFRRASEAYAVLSDDRQRRAYDRSLTTVPPHPREHAFFRTTTWETRNRPPNAKFAWTARKPRPVYHTSTGVKFGAGLRDRTHPVYQNVSQRHSDEHKAHIAFSRISGTARALQLLAGLSVVMWVLGSSGKESG
ncbi:DnaJ-domain-containing protein [Guyanagaster necrorhizus]|uniref:DnaJ-domain-containing protein n=1 Tax=Guyanagaster necrorhizus TaxID=856835 RepID=A0A9P7W1B8_9AGAR|nr:DnaJ-domain-containing protein [Guyanagaster necrorhizus MCA 3950]KAG7451486.1 DnaJ-domain-containing protein [Guyanagaster necrorhizus MCA 3950]